MAGELRAPGLDWTEGGGGDRGAPGYQQERGTVSSSQGTCSIVAASLWVVSECPARSQRARGGLCHDLEYSHTKNET